MNKKLPQEYSYRLNINNGSSLSLICTNESLKELTVGFLYNEGLITGLDGIKDLKISEDGSNAKITLEKCDVRGIKTVRTTGLGGVGLNGEMLLKSIPVREVYSQDYISRCRDLMSEQSVKYAQTGGMHCSALFNSQEMLALFEDIGRHNTLDKLAGRCLLQEIDTSDCLLITTGRISTDMVKKAAMMGVSVVASYTTPTEQAYELARKSGITLIGYMQKIPLQVYCMEERVK